MSARKSARPLRPKAMGRQPSGCPRPLSQLPGWHFREGQVNLVGVIIHKPALVARAAQRPASCGELEPLSSRPNGLSSGMPSPVTAPRPVARPASPQRRPSSHGNDVPSTAAPSAALSSNAAIFTSGGGEFLYSLPRKKWQELRRGHRRLAVVGVEAARRGLVQEAAYSAYS
jgi:hypothetical protein